MAGVSGGDLELALRFKADMQQAVGQLKQVQAQIDGVGASAKDAAASTQQLADSTSAQASSADAAAANEAKLKVQLAEHDAANRAIIESNKQLTASELAKAEAAKAAQASNAAAALALRDARAAEGKAAAKASADAAAALQLFAKIDPVGDKLGKIDALEAELTRLHKAGAVGADDFAAFGALLGANRSKLLAAGEGAEKAAHGMGTLGLQSAFARRELSRMGTDIAMGNFGRLEQTSLTLANSMGLLGPLFTATGAAIAGVTLLVGAYIAAVAAGQAQQNELNRALISTGGIAGVTTGQLAAMRDNIGAATGKFAEAQQALITLAQSGKVGGDALEELGRSAVNLAELTGESTAKVASELAKIGDAPAATIVALNDKYHFLTLAVYEQIRALEDQGRTQDAVKLATDSLASATDAAVEQMNAKLGTLTRAWNAVGDAIHGAAQWFKDFGRDDPEYLLQNARSQLNEFVQKGYARYDARSGVNAYVATDAGKSLPMMNGGMALQIALNTQKMYQATVAQGEAVAQTNALYGTQTAQILHANEAAAALTKESQKRLALMTATTKVQQTQLEIDTGSLKYATPEAQRAALAAAAAEDAKQAQLDAARKSGGRAGLGIDRAQLGADVQAYQQAWQAATAAFANAERTLEGLRKADQITDADYFAAKKADLEKLRDAQIAALEAEKAGLTAHAKTATDRIRIDQQVQGIDAKIAQAREDADAKLDQLDGQRAQAEKQRADEYSQIRQQYLQSIGQDAGAQMLRIEDEYHKAMRQMLAAANDDGQAIVNDLFDVRKAQANLGAMQQAADLAFQSISLVSQRVGADQSAGLLSQLQARQQVIDANLKYADSLRTVAAAAQALAQQTGNPADILHAAQLAEQVRELTLTTSALGEALQGTFTNSFSQFLTDVFTRAKSLGDAFRSLFASIAQGLAKIAADDISQRLFSGLHNLFQPGSSGLGGAASAAAGAAQATTAATTMATGITTGGAAAATSMSTAIIAAGEAAAAAMATAISTAGAASAGASAAGSAAGSTGGIVSFFSTLFGGHASGGLIHGPGTETSDSVFARLSRGEFVQRAAAVRYYGSDFMHALNTMSLPRFADGGVVGGRIPSFLDAAKGTVGPRHLKVVPVFDPAQVAAASAGRDGEQVFVMHFKNNIPALRAMIGSR
ncbi:MAG: phage tail length tape measure family protein [Proteobacteria bacterium]|nr:phage tail length tape measure family protein [Pseudomonadota bacterium]